jgi:hypothetical protein
MPLDLQLNYINGGAAANQAVQVSSLLRSRSVNIAGYDGFSFDAPRNDDDSNADDQKIVADKLAVTLDKNGAGRAVIGKLPALQRPQELLTEMTYSDPNGEVQTISNVTPLWPSAVVVGLRTGNWVSVKKKLTLTAVTLNTAGQPQAGVPVEIRGLARKTNSHRKRMVGGFYAYENDESKQDLGKLCAGKSDQHGMFTCDTELVRSGQCGIDRQRQGWQWQCGCRPFLGVGHRTRRSLVRWREPGPHRHPAREKELPARRDRQLPGPHAVPLRDRPGRGGA